MENKKSYGLNIGASSILVIIVILSLVCFAGLSIASSSADLRLSRKLADRTTDYYNACNLAQQKLRDLCTDSNKRESFTDSLTFKCNINDSQDLEVTFTPVISKDHATHSFRISSYRVINTSLPEMDESLPVLLGD